MPFAAMTLLVEATVSTDENGEARPEEALRFIDWGDIQYVRVAYDADLAGDETMTARIECSKQAADVAPDDPSREWFELVADGPVVDSGSNGPVPAPWNDITSLGVNGYGDVLCRLVISGPPSTDIAVDWLQIEFR